MSILRVFLLNTPDQARRVARDMAGGLGFDRTERMVLPPLDLLSLATVLAARGHSVRLLDSQVEDLGEDAILDACVTFAPDHVVLTASLPTLEHDAAFVRRLRERLPGATIAVKTAIPHPPIQQRLLEESGASLLITGECDLIIDSLLRGETEVGTARMRDGVFVETREIFEKDLDALPILDRSLLRNARYAYPRLGAGTTTMQTSRGCPFSCGYYCPYPMVQGKKWRAMSARRIFEELKNIVEIQGIRKIFFRDATFTLNKKRIRELCDLIEADGLKLSWWCETRIDCLDDDLLAAMRRTGCEGFNVGIESGDDQLLTDLAKQGLTREDIVRFTRRCRELGLKVHFLLMVGLPGESKNSLYQTFTLVEELEPESIGVTTATPYPGTPLYEDAVREGWIVEPELTSFGGHGYNMDIRTVSPRDLEFALERIHEVTKIKSMDTARQTTRRRELHGEFTRWMGGEK